MTPQEYIEEIIEEIYWSIHSQSEDENMEAKHRAVIARLTSLYNHILQQDIEEMEGMGKKELRSPRSFDDNENTVDVSSGYNQALQDLINKKKALLVKEK